MADDPMIRVVILYPVTASDAAKLELLARLPGSGRRSLFRTEAGRLLYGSAQTPGLSNVTLTLDARPELSGSGDGVKLITPLPPQGTSIEVGIAAFTS